MIEEPKRRRVDSRWIDDQSSIGRMKNIAQHVGSGPWPAAMRLVDPFEVVYASTKFLNLISLEKIQQWREGRRSERGGRLWDRRRRGESQCDVEWSVFMG